MKNIIVENVHPKINLDLPEFNNESQLPKNWILNGNDSMNLASKAETGSGIVFSYVTTESQVEWCLDLTMRSRDNCQFLEIGQFDPIEIATRDVKDEFQASVLIKTLYAQANDLNPDQFAFDHGHFIAIDTKNENRNVGIIEIEQQFDYGVQYSVLLDPGLTGQGYGSKIVKELTKLQDCLNGYRLSYIVEPTQIALADREVENLSDEEKIAGLMNFYTEKGKMHVQNHFYFMYAFIQPRNIPSLKSALKAGFVPYDISISHAFMKQPDIDLKSVPAEHRHGSVRDLLVPQIFLYYPYPETPSDDKAAEMQLLRKNFLGLKTEKDYADFYLQFEERLVEDLSEEDPELKKIQWHFGPSSSQQVVDEVKAYNASQLKNCRSYQAP